MFYRPKLNPDGTWEVNPAYKEIHKLREMLVAAGIPHQMGEYFNGWQIGYPEREVLINRVCSVIEFKHSYGHEADLLEIMGLLTPEEEEEDAVVGWLTAEDVFGRIKTHWEANKP